MPTWLPTWLRNTLIALAVLGLAFVAGYFAAPKKTEWKETKVEVRDEEWTKQQIAVAKKEWEKTVHSTKTSITTVVKPCPPANCNPSPEKCVPPCAIDCSKCPTQTVSTTTTTTTDVTEHSTSNSSTSTTSSGASHTTTTTTTEVSSESGGSGLFGAKNLTLTLSANAGVQNIMKPSLATSLGLGLNYRIIGPLGVGAAVYTTKDVEGYLTLRLDKWLLTGGAKTDFRLSGISYGGSVNRRILGPLWLGVGGYSDGSVGISASFVLP